MGDIWLWALKVLVLPLVVVHVMAAIVSAREGGAIGAVGVRAILLFVAMLVAVGALTIAVAAAIVARFPADSSTLAALAEAAPAGVAARAAPEHPSLLEWLAGLLPANPVAAALAGNVLPLLLLGHAPGIPRVPDVGAGARPADAVDSRRSRGDAVARPRALVVSSRWASWFSSSRSCSRRAAA